MTPLVATVLELTDRVQAAIDSGDWQQAQQLEGERRALLEQLAAIPDVAVRPTLVALEQRNYRLIGLVEHHKRRILREAAVERTGHAGAAAYVDVDRSPAVAETA